MSGHFSNSRPTQPLQRLREVASTYNRATDDTLRLANEFIVVVAQRKN